MMMKNQSKTVLSASETAAELSAQDNILIVSHKKPDGDTMGSSAALCRALKRYGKNAWLLNNSGFTARQLGYVSELTADESFVWNYTVSVDVADDDMFPDGFSGKIDLCIDHHGSNPLFGEKNCVCPERASCAEVVLAVIENLVGDPDPKEADLLYIGLSTDCGCFRYGNTDAASHLAAAKLIECGADVYSLNQIFFEKTSAHRVALESMLYEGFRSLYDGKVIVSLLTLDMLSRSGVNEDDLDNIASLPLRIEGVELAVTVRELPDGSSKVSARSGKGFSCVELCSRFGGGGHPQASGCTINKAYPDAVSLLLCEIDKLWKKI
ncbi:MAG: DHH family phosphoesterase [Eubacteriales bacterium]|nr:DHH family phosphoesterase [Eubacteriales bacterium]